MLLANDSCHTMLKLENFLIARRILFAGSGNVRSRLRQSSVQYYFSVHPWSGTSIQRAVAD